MRWSTTSYLFLPSLVLASFSDVVPTRDCPILGPTFPLGFDLTQSNAIRAVNHEFPALIKSLFSSGIIDSKQSSFTIDVFSTARNESLYSYAHAAAGLNSTLTAGVLNDETIFRIGSVSKLYTAYAIIAQAGIEVLDHPVTRYLPELGGNSRADFLSNIIWEDVTIGALMSQQGGSGGIPLEIAGCNAVGNCSVPSFLAAMKEKRPFTPLWQTPAYSDAGFATLGRVLERITGMKYEEAIHEVLSVPLGLNSTSTTVPKGSDVNALAVTDSLSTWGWDNQITAPSGGIYANNADLRTLGLSILNSELLSDTVTRQWMKPRGHTATLTSSVGAPWEIARLTIPVTAGSNRTRVSDLYTKGGGNPPYGAVIGLSPDHGIGFSVLVAGPNALTDRWVLRDAIASTFVPAAEFAAEENAARNFVGTFVDASTDDTNLTLTIDEGQPGLRLESMFISGIDWRANLTTIGGADVQPTIRLYPSGLVLPQHSTGQDVTVVFNAVPYGAPPGPRAAIEGGEGLFDYACAGWLSAGFFYLHGHAIDQFVFRVKEGRLSSVEYGSAGSVMKRID